MDSNILLNAFVSCDVRTSTVEQLKGAIPILDAALPFVTHRNGVVEELHCPNLSSQLPLIYRLGLEFSSILFTAQVSAVFLLVFTRHKRDTRIFHQRTKQLT